MAAGRDGRYASRMRPLAVFVAAIVGTMFLAAALAYPLYSAVHPLVPEMPFHKVVSRWWQLLMLGAVAVAVWRLGLRSRAAWGYGTPRRAWVRQFLAGLAIGLASMLPVTVAMLALDLRPLRDGLDASRVGELLLIGAASGLAVGFVEETFFRGLVQGAVVREMRRPLAGIALVSVLYAAMHFLERVRIPPDEVGWTSGFTLLASTVTGFADPARIGDSFLALVVVGLLLGLVTCWTGSIALAVGLHAGWVWVMRTTVGMTTLNPDAPLAWLVNAKDGYTGWLVVGAALAFLAVAVALRARLRALGGRGGG